jgi:hypothetical protein
MKEMGKLAENKGMLIEKAEDYLSRGCSRDETEELLSIDGFDPDMISAYLTSFASSEPAESETGSSWGFEVKGSCGDKVTHEDLDIEIRASTKEEATIKLQAIMDKEKDAGLEKIINVYEL